MAEGDGRGGLQGAAPPLEIWGGVECSVVRLGEQWRDQIRETGHHDRGVADLDLLAGLGLRTLRYPLSWERLADSPQGWEWQDRQLHTLHRRGINVIAGLLHHGSGPAGTSLTDPALAEKLAAHAGRAAERYGFVRDWIVVNEPLTTARFSALYGIWYPHARDHGVFLRAVVNQCRAALRAMRAIRAQASGARFVHTEDVGRVFATRPLAGRARYENERRWLSLDLLCGRIGAAHPWRAELEAHGVAPRHLDELATGEAAPDLIGVNHYVTSDRFLDHRLQLYPPHLHGGDGSQAYADTEAVRTPLDERVTGWAPRLREVWERYARPIAITEAHLGCDDGRESVRWLMEAWEAAKALRADGADIRAVTAWGVFGLVDWDSMLVQRRGRYEAGAFDARHAPPRATLLASAIASLARRGEFVDEALEEPGWWRRKERILTDIRGVPIVTPDIVPPDIRDARCGVVADRAAAPENPLATRTG